MAAGRKRAVSDGVTRVAVFGAAFGEGEWHSADGLTLRYRDYPGRADRPPILCIPGLTRNARDFEPVAGRLAGEWRVICADLRGRGQSDYAKDATSYNPLQYADDIAALLDQAGLPRVAVFGTSLGGIVAMLLAARDPARIAGVLLNDVGPEIEPAGLARIREYVGQGRSFPTWMHAARGLRELTAAAHPDFAIDDWRDLAKRLMCVGSNGRIVFDYDMKIAEPFHQPPPDGAPADMWPAFRALAEKPLLVVRGEVSDILSAETLARMLREAPGARAATIARTGHAPTLDEPEARAAIAQLLERIA